MPDANPALSEKADGQAGENSSTRVQAVLDGIVGHIRTNRLRVGDSLPGELQLARDFGVSRSVVREAMGALAALKLVDIGNGRRPRVAASSMSFMALSLDHALGTEQIDFLEVWEFRRGLERQAAMLAAVRRTPEQASRISALAHRLLDVRNDLAALVDTDVEFHRAIAAASRNKLLLQILMSFGSLMKQVVPVAWQARETGQETETIFQKHLALARAIAEKNPDAALRAMDEHFDRTLESIMVADRMFAGQPCNTSFPPA